MAYGDDGAEVSCQVGLVGCAQVSASGNSPSERADFEDKAVYISRSIGLGLGSTWGKEG